MISRVNQCDCKEGIT